MMAAPPGPVIDLLIQVQDEYSGMRPALPVPITAMVGRIATATAVPIARVADLARDPHVARIAPARRYHTMNDVSVPETGATAAWTEFDTKGGGVIVAIIDTGIDPEHLDFKLPGGGPTRILNLLDLSVPGSGPFGGTLYDAAQINAGANTDDPVGHGTHVAGSAAGGGASDSTFRGVAPEADLIIVNADRNGVGSFSTADIVNSLAFVDERAAAFGKPYVANLSLGGHDGAHDGTSLEEIAIDDLIGLGKAGKAVVIAAGNEASSPPRHAAAEVSGKHSFTVLVPPNYVPGPRTGDDFVLVNIWFESSSDFQLTVTPPGGAPIGPFPVGTWNGPSGTLVAQGLVGVDNTVNGTDPENGDREASVILVDGPTPPAGGNWLFTLEGDTGHFDAYIAQSSIFGPTGQSTRFTTDLQLGGFVAEPGTARNAITVGAYVTKTQWTDLDGQAHDLGDFFPGIMVGARAVFSNIGPTRDGRYKPEIAAPGMIIGSCFSHDAPPGSPASSFNSPFPEDFPNFFILNESYGLQQGTSQASPHVAGAIALIFSLHPEWDIMDVRQALTSTAREDQHTGIPPNFQFGYGKLDVLEALRLAETPGSLPGDVTGDNEVDINDAQLVIGFVLGTATPTPAQEYLADMNRDGTRDVTDVVLIVRAALATGGGLAALPSTGAAGAPPAAGTFILPVTIDAAEHVAGIDVQLASRHHRPDAAAASAAGDRVLALGASGREAGSARVIALSLDGSNLAGRHAGDPAAVPARGIQTAVRGRLDRGAGHAHRARWQAGGGRGQARSTLRRAGDARGAQGDGARPRAGAGCPRDRVRASRTRRRFCRRIGGAGDGKGAGGDLRRRRPTRPRARSRILRAWPSRAHLGRPRPARPGSSRRLLGASRGRRRDRRLAAHRTEVRGEWNGNDGDLPFATGLDLRLCPGHRPRRARRRLR